jgi:acyl transferase domain-containing protein
MPSADSSFLEAAGRLWLAGVKLNWSALHSGEARRRVPLPGYPFERKRFWIDFQPGRPEPQREQQAAKRAVSLMYERPASLGNEYAKAESETETSVQEIWQEVFGIQEIGIHDDFFALGGHSLLATQLIAEVRESFEIELPLQKFFEAPTVAGLAIVVEEALIQKIDRMSEEDAQNLLR